jgi:hypothetical protein
MPGPLSFAKFYTRERVVNNLRARAAKAIKDCNVDVLVGYTSSYAIYVHENIEMKWRGFPRDRSVRPDQQGIARTGYAPIKGKFGLFWGPHGQAKFLEAPARQSINDGTFGRMMTSGVKGGLTFAQALLACGLFLQRASMELVPVEYGFLRASAFTRMERR